MEQQLRDPTIVVRGEVPDDLVAYASDKLSAILGGVSAPVLDVVLRLDHHPDPARERPEHVEVTVDLDGHAIRAHRSAPTMPEAIDRALARLQRRLEAAGEQERARRLRHRDTESWHHGDRKTERPDHFVRPVDDRVVVRRKSFVMAPESIEGALFDLETLDHDFFLFIHDESGMEAVVYRAGDGYGIAQRVPTPDAIRRVEIPLDDGRSPATTTLDEALAVLDASDAPFEFFVDAQTGGGSVAYRRYDGNYGLIVAA